MAKLLTKRCVCGKEIESIYPRQFESNFKIHQKYCKKVKEIKEAEKDAKN